MTLSSPDPSGRPELTELHTHLGFSVPTEVMWALAHQNGIKLPTRSYWDFVNTIQLPEASPKNKDFHEMFKWTEMIQTGTVALERSTYEAVGSFYRSSNVTRLELRFNPMKRNRGGEHDLDQVIVAAARGMEQACSDYGTKAGLILMLDTRFSPELNKIIAQKAVAHKWRGVVGVDIAGPSAHKSGLKFKGFEEAFTIAKKGGLGITVHAGEEAGTSNEVIEAIDLLGAQRIGHGIQALGDPKALRLLADRGVTLEFCPTSNLRRGIFPGLDVVKKAVDSFVHAGVKFCLCTDDPEMYGITPKSQRDFLAYQGVINQAQLDECEETARKASFIK